jgi:hypothetical protein
MATIGTAVTLQDLQSRLDENDKIAPVIELLTDTNEMLEDMMWVEGNLLTGHKTTVRTGIPEATWRKLNYGVPSTKSTTRQITDECGMLEVYAKTDKALADLNGNSAAWRLSEEAGFVEGINQQLSSALIYGDSSTDPEQIMGLAPRYVTPSANEDLSGFNMIDGGAVDGQTDTASIWLVGWGPNSVHGIYPKGSKAGLSMRDLGEDTFTDAAGGEYQGYRTHYKWDCGLTVRDWRYVSRCVNIDLTDVLAGNFDFSSKMIDMMERVPMGGGVKWAFYMHRTLRTAMRKKNIAQSTSQTTFDTVGGKRVLAFDDVPVRRLDSLLKTETAVLDAAGTFGS